MMKLSPGDWLRSGEMHQGWEESQQSLCHHTSYHFGNWNTHQLGNSGNQCQTCASELLPIKGEGAGLFIHRHPFLVQGAAPNHRRVLVGR